MKTFSLLLTEPQLQALVYFFERVNLTGPEAESYLIVKQAISLARLVEEVQEEAPPNRAARRRAAKSTE